MRAQYAAENEENGYWLGYWPVTIQVTTVVDLLLRQHTEP